jgi:hypothetical protein
MKKKYNLTYHGCDFQIWHHGQEFYRAAAVLKETKNISAPYYICLSFSIELFIKCLDTTTEYKSASNVKLSVHTRSRQHSLSDLFSQLPDEMKSDCEKKYSKMHTRSLAKDVEHISDVFVKYRYQYEDINEKKQRVLCVSVLEDVGAFFDEYSTNVGHFSQELE